MEKRAIAIIGTGYVGLVTAVSLAELGHNVICVDIDKNKINLLMAGKSPIYEPGLETLLVQNLKSGRLSFTWNHRQAIQNADIIYLAVGTPSLQDGSVDLSYLMEAAKEISLSAHDEIVVVTKSTVPVGTSEIVKKFIEKHAVQPINVHVVSNPEFLREGQALQDTFHADRIVIGADDDVGAKILMELYEPLHLNIIRTDLRSAELIKYASNAFLATKISFINEIANICERLNANIEDVARGMGSDSRIGTQFLKAGIGYGGSCFPKDTNALMQIAGNLSHQFELLEAVIHVNNRQQSLLFEKAKTRFAKLKHLKIALLGLSFKPNTDDLRESPALPLANKLIQDGAKVIAFDPVAYEKGRKLLPDEVKVTDDIRHALQEADLAFIVTDWDVIKDFPLALYEKLMKRPVIFDGRNCFALSEVSQYAIEYHSIGRQSIYRLKEVSLKRQTMKQKTVSSINFLTT
ncbi:UDP-glucose dehydrogenase family protein [Robertmurraya siralis]|uniref:UDP-glucose dehydrogenase family protein n=1 Tax=Robertmurraya siralis TaxID=77777 RepID=UPI0010F5026C|nr:UDP-glucose/GDP-mannose dehydrogenase family protein [Robertmurraya siralis]